MLASGLYEDKHDINLGRLQESLDERAKWIEENAPWSDIKEGVSFSEEDSKVTVYIELPPLAAQDAGSSAPNPKYKENDVVVWFSDRSMEVRVLVPRTSKL